MKFDKILLTFTTLGYLVSSFYKSFWIEHTLVFAFNPVPWNWELEAGLGYFGTLAFILLVKQTGIENDFVQWRKSRKKCKSTSGDGSS